jgi:ABC-type branched-subunit amino acid transport system permease subunit
MRSEDETIEQSKPDPLTPIPMEEAHSAGAWPTAVIALAFVLPAVGMIVGGFDAGRLRIGCLGIAVCVVLAIVYFNILRWTMRPHHDF